MARELREIDRLIEEGLTLYGTGDLDGALLVWEQALGIDPDNPQANSYVDYVRLNYALLTNEAADDMAYAPFGIADDDVEYQVEILPGDPTSDEPPAYATAIDEGWYIEAEPREPRRDEPIVVPQEESDETGKPAANGQAVELEAEEPPQPEISFEDMTREYPGGPPKAPPRQRRATSTSGAREFPIETTPTPGFDVADIATPGFESVSSGFGTQVTDIRKRDLGFVKSPSQEAPPAVAQDLPVPPRASAEMPAAPDPEEGASRAARNSELKMTLRTPSLDAFDREAGDDDDEPELELGADVPPPPSNAEIELTYETDDEPRRDEPAPPAPEAPADDLLASLPTPTPAPSIAQMASPIRASAQMAAQPTPAADEPKPKVITKDLPGPTRAPAPPTAELTPAPAAPPPPTVPPPTVPTATQDFDLKTTKLPPVSPGTRFVDSGSDSGVPTNKLPQVPASARPEPPVVAPVLPGVPPKDPMLSAPTRDLGLRTQARPGTEDEPTGQSDASLIRAMAAAKAVYPRAESPAIDTTDARIAAILEDVDALAPNNESREDKTRRRISTLFERAIEWSRTDLERAVAAIELALSEDASSALAQKLIHRNRDTMQNVFQAFLGDLERTPILARPLHELGTAPISPRAAFLLSRIDGSLSLDEILDVSGMPRLEAYRYLCQLFLRGILR